jgi:hypothetical protein
MTAMVYPPYFVPPYNNNFDGIVAVNAKAKWNEIDPDNCKVIPKS